MRRKLVLKSVFGLALTIAVFAVIQSRFVCKAQAHSAVAQMTSTNEITVIKQSTKVEKDSKKYTVATCRKTKVNIRKKASSSSKVVATLKSGDQVRVIKTVGNWIYINKNGKKGYVYHTLLKITSNSTEKVEDSQGVTGSDVVKYALKFVGNRYRYGGTSLTKGTDCSGFTMSVYRHFNYSIPRSSRAQAASAGKKVSLNQLKPGDLLFYKRGGRIGHVAMYIGNSKIVHASTRKTGIKISNYNYSSPCMARRIIY